MLSGLYYLRALGCSGRLRVGGSVDSPYQAWRNKSLPWFCGSRRRLQQVETMEAQGLQLSQALHKGNLAVNYRQLKRVVLGMREGDKVMNEQDIRKFAKRLLEKQLATDRAILDSDIVFPHEFHLDVLDVVADMMGVPRQEEADDGYHRDWVALSWIDDVVDRGVITIDDFLDALVHA